MQTGNRYFLTTQQLGFRHWTDLDLPLARGLWGDPRVTQYITREPLSDDQVRDRLQREIATMQCHEIQYWPVFLLVNGEHIGCGGLRPYQPEMHEFGVHLRPEYRRKGYGEEIGLAVIQYAFTQLRTKSLFAGHHPNNDASRHLLGKLGFRYTHHEFYPPTGLQHPAYVLSADAFQEQMNRGSPRPR